MHSTWETAAMAEAGTSRVKRIGWIKDAHGRKVTQLDPVAMHLRQEREIIEGDVLRAIAGEEGVRVRGLERTALFLLLTFIAPFLGISLFTYEVITGEIQEGPYARFAGMVWLCCIPWVAWYMMKRSRRRRVKAAMLKHYRCPHCGHKLQGLKEDETDGATACPGCGCAWRLDRRRSAAGSHDG